MNENNQLAINTLDDMERVGKLIAGGGMFGITNAQQAVCLMLICHSEGLNPIGALKRYHIIEGRPSRRADSVLADFEAQGGAVIWHARTDEMVGATFFADRKLLDDKARERARARFGHMWALASEQNADKRALIIDEIGKISQEGEETLIRTLADADEKKLSMSWDKDRKEWKRKHNWNQSPRQMLTARVSTEGVKLIRPGVIAGMSTDDEVRDVLEQEREKLLGDAFGGEPATAQSIDDLRREYDEVQARIGLADPKDRTPLYALRARLQVKIEEWEGAQAEQARTANAAPTLPATAPEPVTEGKAPEPEKPPVVDATNATVEPPVKSAEKPAKKIDEPSPGEKKDWRTIVCHVGVKLKDKTLGEMFVDKSMEDAQKLAAWWQQTGGYMDRMSAAVQNWKDKKAGAPLEEDMALYQGLRDAFDYLEGRAEEEAKGAK